MTTPTKQAELKHDWHLVDVQDQTLGRISTTIAQQLMGKSKPNFVRNLDCGDYVVVINASSVKVTGKKEENKVYARHSGYPGGFRSETLKELRSRKPEDIIRHAVKGMLPDNRLRDKMLKRLFVFAGNEHTYADKFVKKEETK
jgi:large subunit ribosomal protein L13